jgi:hypothetical protein
MPPDNQVQQVELLGKVMLYDKQLSVKRNEACAFCHMPETGFTGLVSERNRTTGSYPARCARGSANASRRRTPMRRCRRCCITIPVRVISWAAISGTCVRPAGDWAIRPPSRPRVPQQTPWKWACPTRLARFTALRSGRIAPCSRGFGGQQAFAIRGAEDEAQGKGDLRKHGESSRYALASCWRRAPGINRLDGWWV